MDGDFGTRLLSGRGRGVGGKKMTMKHVSKNAFFV